METNPAVDLRKAYKTTVIIGLAMMASLLIYAVVVETIKKQQAPFEGYAPMPDTIEMLRYALLALSIAEFFIIRLIDKLNLSGRLPVPSKYQTGRYGQYSPSAQRLISGSIMTFALCESVAIYGLVLFLVQGNSNDFYIFLIVSLFYFTVFFPKYSAWEAWMKGREKAERQ